MSECVLKTLACPGLRVGPRQHVSSVVLDSGNASGAFLQTTAPILDKTPGPMAARFLSIVGLGFGTRIGRKLFPTPALNKTRFL